MLAIRLARIGKKNKAQYKIVLQEHTVAPGGRHVEILGSYDPHSKRASIKSERVKYWISKGAQASDTAHNLFVSQNIIAGKKISVKMPKKAEEVKTEEAKPTEVKPEEVKLEASASAGTMADKPAEVKVEESKPEEPKKEEK